MERRFGLTGLDPDLEVVCSIDSKEAIHNTFLAFVEAEDYTVTYSYTDTSYERVGFLEMIDYHLFSVL